MSEREKGLAGEVQFRTRRSPLPVCVCSLRQVLLRILDLIKSAVRQRRAEREEAAFGKRGREREDEKEHKRQRLDLLLHVEVNGKEQALSS